MPHRPHSVPDMTPFQTGLSSAPPHGARSCTLTPAITVSSLSKTYASYIKRPGVLGSLMGLLRRERVVIEALKRVSFEIAEGEIVGLIGPNGAGKTTTLKALSGILYPSTGEAHVLGHIPWERRKDYLRSMALVMGMKNQLLWDLPPMDTFFLNKEIYEVPNRAFTRTVSFLSDLLDVTHCIHIQTRNLSLGERMKCELIAALLHAPRVLFLDEPTIGLDIVSQKRIRDFLKDYNSLNRTTILITSHHMDDIVDLCARTIIMDHGAVIYDGNLTDLHRRYARHKMVRAVTGQPIRKSMVKGLGRLAELDGARFSLEVPRKECPKIAQEILRRFPVTDITIEEIPIEEIIRRIFLGTPPTKKRTTALL